MKFECVKTCGIYRKGHLYEIERPLPVLAMSAIRAGHLVAASGWCAPSETLYAIPAPDFEDGLLSLPELKTVRGGVKFDDKMDEPTKKKRDPRKDVQPDTLESLAEQTSAGLEGLRGEAGI